MSCFHLPFLGQRFKTEWTYFISLSLNIYSEFRACAALLSLSFTTPPQIEFLQISIRKIFKVFCYLSEKKFRCLTTTGDGCWSFGWTDKDILSGGNGWHFGSTCVDTSVCPLVFRLFCFSFTSILFCIFNVAVFFDSNAVILLALMLLSSF